MPCRRSNALRRDSGDCPWIALRRSPVPKWNQKDAEGVKPVFGLISQAKGRRKGFKRLFYAEFLYTKTPFFFTSFGTKRRKKNEFFRITRKI